MPALDSLLPEYQAQYNALMPEIERKVRQDLVRRGMSYSGNAGDTLARAQAQILAELAAKSAETNTAQQEAERQRQFAGEQASENRRAEQRAQRLSLLGSTVGGLGTLGAMYVMRPAAGSNVNIVPTADGKFLSYDPKTRTMRPIATEGVEGGITEPGGGVMTGAGGPAATQPSMWQKAGGFSGLAAGAGGGLLGSQLSSLIAGRSTGTAGGVGAGLGGLGGYAAGMRFGGGNPWAAGLGALLGSTGGGLLGNLFK